MRQLASVQKIIELHDIPGADNILLAKVLGWNVIVAKKDNYKVNDLVVYCEIDSILPEREPFMFLSTKKFRIKTMKLNKFGVISQGIVFPLSILPDGRYSEGDDVTEIIGVTKYEENDDVKTEFELKKTRSVFVNYMMRYEWFRKTFMRWFIRGKDNKGFPSFISKTDETRIQNLFNTFEREWKGTSGWYVTEKMEGQSLTNFLVTVRKKKFFGLKTVLEKTFGVCSRSIYLKTQYNCNWWNVTIKESIKEKLEQVPYDVAIQGEICGPGIQGNIYKFTDLKLFVFNVKNLNTNKMYSNEEVREFCIKYGFTMVPTLHEEFTMPDDIESLIKLSNGRSLYGDTLREGMVFRKGNVSFKVVSPEYLVYYGK